MIYTMIKYPIVILSISLAFLLNDPMHSVHAEEILLIPGDIDGDGDADGGDLTVLSLNFGKADGSNLGSDWDFSITRSLPHLSNDNISFQNVLIENKRYMVTMKFDMGRLVPISREEINTVEIPFRTIIIDGDDADWVAIPPVVADPADDEHPNYDNVTGTDLENVYMAHDDTYLYFRMTFHDGDPIEGQYTVEFQQYLNQLHTPGDISASAETEPGIDWRVIVGDRSPCGVITEHSADYIGIGAGMIEWKVLINDMQYPPSVPLPYFSPVLIPPGIENQFIRAYIHPYPYLGVSDENDGLTRPMIVNFYD